MWRIDVTLKELTKSFPEAREIFEDLNFNLQWLLHGREFNELLFKLDPEEQKLYIATMSALAQSVIWEIK